MHALGSAPERWPLGDGAVRLKSASNASKTIFVRVSRNRASRAASSAAVSKAFCGVSCARRKRGRLLGVVGPDLLFGCWAQRSQSYDPVALQRVVHDVVFGAPHRQPGASARRGRGRLARSSGGRRPTAAPERRGRRLRPVGRRGATGRPCEPMRPQAGRSTRLLGVRVRRPRTHLGATRRCLSTGTGPGACPCRRAGSRASTRAARPAHRAGRGASSGKRSIRPNIAAPRSRLSTRLPKRSAVAASPAPVLRTSRPRTPE